MSFGFWMAINMVKPDQVPIRMVIPNGIRLKHMTTGNGAGSIGNMYTALWIIGCSYSRIAKEAGKFLLFWQEIDNIDRILFYLSFSNLQ